VLLHGKGLVLVSEINVLWRQRNVNTLRVISMMTMHVDLLLSELRGTLESQLCTTAATYQLPCITGYPEYHT
jgi:hypothetical protein